MSFSPGGRVCICPGEQVLFTCQVSEHDIAPPQIHWLIHFEAPDLSDVHQSYVISADHLGDMQTDSRNGYNFTFNLTKFNYNDNNTSFLTSTLMITIARSSNVNTFNKATITCNQEQNEAVLQICTGNHLVTTMLLYESL